MAKAGRPKKGSAGLPTWFDINKYRRAQGFDTAQWFHQLAFRRLLRDMADPESERPFFAELTSLIQTDPVVTVPRIISACPINKVHGLEQYFQKACLSYVSSEMAINTRRAEGIRPITNGDIVTAHQVLRFFRPPAVVSGAKDKPSSKSIIKNRIDYWDKPYSGSKFGRSQYLRHVTVDLSLPHVLLKRNFAEYIKAEGKLQTESKSPFSKHQEFSTWYKSGVLPYLDLHLWEIISGQSFRWASFVDALNTITDESVGSEDACRKTAKSLAAKLLDENLLRMLNFQAAKEQGRSGAKSGKLFVR